MFPGVIDVDNFIHGLFVAKVDMLGHDDLLYVNLPAVQLLHVRMCARSVPTSGCLQVSFIEETCVTSGSQKYFELPVHVEQNKTKCALLFPLLFCLDHGEGLL